MSDIALNKNYTSVEEHEDHPEIASQDLEWFDLTPIEKKLCGGSMALGIVLLGVFLLAFEL